MSALLPESIRLARAAWDVATPGTRVLFFLRTRYAARQGIDRAEMGLPFLPWDELPAEVASELAWDVQFLRRVLGDGHAALKAATAIVEGSSMSAVA